MNLKKRIAIIGAGPSGLAAIKCCMEEDMEPACFERSREAGGLWTFREEDTDGMSSVMKNTVTNTGKEMTAFSDFPPPDDFPNFMHHTMMRKYLMMYAEKFDLLRHIRFNSEVIKVEPTHDYKSTGRWTVSVKNTETSETTHQEYDGVMVCIGHHVYPKIPTFPGREKFRGTIMHSHSVKDCDQFSGRNVVVVGIGNSGGDVAVDSSFAAEKVYLSTRRGAWIHSRIGKNGRPYEMDIASRERLVLRPVIPFEVRCEVMETKLNQKFDHEAYKLKPEHRVLNAHPTINDFLPFCIISGRVIVKGDIERFEENGVVFAGEETVTGVDVVVLSTGYLIRFPFLGDVIETGDNQVELYKYVIPPHLEHPTLGILGLVQPRGSIDPVSEMQSRWFTQVLIGKIKLPSVEDMLVDIKSKRADNEKIYVNSSRHTIEVDWITFMDELAAEIGAKPDMRKMAITDPKLFQACFFGPCLPYQYRLQGPHAWSGARDALLSYEDRVFTPLNNNKKVISKGQPITPSVTVLPFMLTASIDIAVATINILYNVTAFSFCFTFNTCKRQLLKILN